MVNFWNGSLTTLKAKFSDASESHVKFCKLGYQFQKLKKSHQQVPSSGLNCYVLYLLSFYLNSCSFTEWHLSCQLTVLNVLGDWVSFGVLLCYQFSGEHMVSLKWWLCVLHSGVMSRMCWVMFPVYKLCHEPEISSQMDMRHYDTCNWSPVVVSKLFYHYLVKKCFQLLMRNLNMTLKVQSLDK